MNGRSGTNGQTNFCYLLIFQLCNLLSTILLTHHSFLSIVFQLLYFIVAHIKLSVRKIPPNFALLATKKSKKRFPTAFSSVDDFLFKRTYVKKRGTLGNFVLFFQRSVAELWLFDTDLSSVPLLKSLSLKSNIHKLDSNK